MKKDTFFILPLCPLKDAGKKNTSFRQDIHYGAVRRQNAHSGSQFDGHSQFGYTVEEYLDIFGDLSHHTVMNIKNYQTTDLQINERRVFL